MTRTFWQESFPVAAHCARVKTKANYAPTLINPTQMANDLDQPRLGKHGGKRIKGLQGDAVSAVTLRLRGNSRAYILARLERDGFVHWAEAIRAHRVSAHAVAVELGWSKGPEPRYGQPRRRPFDAAALIG